MEIVLCIIHETIKAWHKIRVKLHELIVFKIEGINAKRGDARIDQIKKINLIV
jgi:hypothetical protein